MNEYDMLISFSRIIDHNEKNTIYLQYGLIYKELKTTKLDKYLQKENKKMLNGFEDNPYNNIAIGFGLYDDKLKECIESQSNKPFWESTLYKRQWDLRNPKNIEIKREIFCAFGLDANKSYEENLKIVEKRSVGFGLLSKISRLINK